MISIDIIKRLRDVSFYGSGHAYADVACREAADEIERLRAREARLREALAWYVDNDDTNEVDPENAFWIAGRDRARAALEEKK